MGGCPCASFTPVVESALLGGDHCLSERHRLRAGIGDCNSGISRGRGRRGVGIASIQRRPGQSDLVNPDLVNPSPSSIAQPLEGMIAKTISETSFGSRAF
jgi:hypothetical protein